MKNIIAKKVKAYLNESKYDNPAYRKAMDIYDVPVDFMWDYREFDRCGDDNLYGDEYVDELENDIKKNGIKSPITLWIDMGKALVVEGNHRLCIAKRLGFETIPVRVEYNSFGSINSHKAKPINYSSSKWEAGVFD